MKSTGGKEVLFVLIGMRLLMCCVYGSIKTKDEVTQLSPLSDVASELADQDLKAALSSLSSTELKTLSEYIDEEGKQKRNDAFEDVADAYNKDDVLFEDLYDEQGKENVELNTGSEAVIRPLKLPENKAKGRNGEKIDKDDTIRTKRNSQGDLEEDIMDIDDYFKDLENSFPQNQKGLFNNTDEVDKEHIRVKRLEIF